MKKPKTPAKPTSEMTTEELIAALRKTQKKGDVLVEITDTGIKTTIGK